jgi:tetratricopeptide (TPR) repeat protein
MRAVLRLTLSVLCALAAAGLLHGSTQALDKFKPCNTCTPGCPSACPAPDPDLDTSTTQTEPPPRLLTDQEIAQDLNRQGRAATENGDYETAFARFKEALRLDPGNEDILTNLRWAQESQRSQRAQERAQERAQIAEDDGDLAFERQDWLAAAEHYARALEDAPHDAELRQKFDRVRARHLLVLARDARRRGQRALELEYLDHACDLSPEVERRVNCDSFHELSALIAQERGDHAFARGRWATAAIHYRRAARHLPGDPDILARLNNALAKSGHSPALTFSDRWNSRPADRARIEAFVRDIVAAPDKRLAQDFSDWLKDNVTIELVSRRGSTLIDPYPLGKLHGKLNVDEWFLQNNSSDARRINLLVFEFGKTLWSDLNDNVADSAITGPARVFYRLKNSHPAIGEMRSAGKKTLGTLTDNDIESHFAFALRVVLFNLKAPEKANEEEKAEWDAARRAMRKYLRDQVL